MRKSTHLLTSQLNILEKSMLIYSTSMTDVVYYKPYLSMEINHSES